MFQFYKQFSQPPKNDDYEQNINTLNMQVAQLRRQNLFLRKKLQRMKPKDQPKKTMRTRTHIQQTHSDNDAPEQSAQVCLLKQLSVIKQNLRRVFPNSITLKSIKPVSWRVEQSNCEAILQSGLERVSTTRGQNRYRALLQVVYEYHASCCKHETKMQETLNEAADYVRRINQVLVVRLTQMKKSHDLTGHKMAVLKLLYQQAKQETGSALKEMRKIMDRMGEQVKQMAEKKEEKIEPKKVS